jgi:hypothetical protein
MAAACCESGDLWTGCSLFVGCVARETTVIVCVATTAAKLRLV